MSETPKKEISAGGFWIAVGALAGFGIGVSMGQPSAGTVIGTGIGVAIAVAMWLKSRN